MTNPTTRPPGADERRWKEDLIGITGAGAIHEVRDRIEALEAVLLDPPEQQERHYAYVFRTGLQPKGHRAGCKVCDWQGPFVRLQSDAKAHARQHEAAPGPQADSVEQERPDPERVREALESLTHVVEREWPNLRVPKKVERNPPALVGARLRRAAEQARTALSQTPDNSAQTGGEERNG